MIFKTVQSPLSPVVDLAVSAGVPVHAGASVWSDTAAAISALLAANRFLQDAILLADPLWLSKVWNFQQHRRNLGFILSSNLPKDICSFLYLCKSFICRICLQMLPFIF
jgi:hypothetical protein